MSREKKEEYECDSEWMNAPMGKPRQEQPVKDLELARNILCKFKYGCGWGWITPLESREEIESVLKEICKHIKPKTSWGEVEEGNK